MKKSQWICLAACAAWLGAACAQAATYYINDASTEADLYCSAAGNVANTGRSKDSPKNSWASLTNAVSIVAGDTVYFDTGTYDGYTLVSNCSGTEEAPIRLLGSPRGTVFKNTGRAFALFDSTYVDVEDIVVEATGADACRFNWAVCCSLRNFSITVAGNTAITAWGAVSNRFQNGVIKGFSSRGWHQESPSCKGNEFVRVNIISSGGIVFSYPADAGLVPSLEECIIEGANALTDSSILPTNVVRNIIRVGYVNSEHGSVESAQNALPGWERNTAADPVFADMANENYHLASPMGYVEEQKSANGYVTNHVWVTNAALAYAPGIDLGNPADGMWTNEPAPNGGRVNIGAYGGTAWASKSRPNSQKWLQALSYNDGGHLIGSGTLEWNSGNFGAADKVRIQISTNGGAGWTTLATNVLATKGTYTWTPKAVHQTPIAKWRVQSLADSSVASENQHVFGVRTSEETALHYYVNDDSTEGDVYCTAAGSDDNSGGVPNAPMASLQKVLDTYQLLGGDVVYVDTGTYSEQTVTFTAADSGTDERHRVRVVGSTNGVVFARGNTTYDVFVLDGISHLAIEDVTLQGGRYGVYFPVACSDIRFSGAKLSGNRYGIYEWGDPQWVFAGGEMLDNRDAAVHKRGTIVTNQIRNSVLWGNGTAVNVAKGLAISNSVIGSNTKVFGNQVVPGDYNVLWANGSLGASLATMADLQGAEMGWVHSFVADPLFADVEGGDFHPKSVTGRWDPMPGKWVKTDKVHSPLIDAGDPAEDVGAETKPNGGRLNIGAYGGTAQASRSRTNAWVQALTFNDGGTLDAQQGATLRWNAGNLASGATATISLSRDGGTTWEVLKTGVSAADGEYFYRNTDTNDASALEARWKVEVGTGVSSMCATNFAYKNGAYVFYVNDESRTGDVYCTDIGNDANSGMSKGAPMATLSALLAKYALGPGDRVYVDTGTYDLPSAIVFTAGDSGTDTNAVQIIGSTNRAANGTLFGNRGSVRARAFQFAAGASNIVLRNLVVTNYNVGISAAGTENIALEGMEFRGVRGQGVEVSGDVDGFAIRHVAFDGGGTGVSLANATNVVVEHCVFHDLGMGLSLGAGVQVDIRNNVLSSSKAGGLLLSYSSLANVTMDYNGLDAAGGCRIAANADNLAAWQKVSGGQDLHSVPGDPLLADPGNFDYHLKTEQTLGRYTPEGWTSDTESSPLLDAGAPASDASAEPAPNGGRVNIGMYGGTAEASKALDRPWLRAVSFADAGSVGSETATLRWIAGGGITGTVRVAVSRDGGATWSNVANNVQASAEEYAWNASKFADSPAGLWRVTSRTDTSVVSDNGAFFAIRKKPLSIYVATANTNETVYVKAPGRATNYLATAAAPLDSLKRALELYDLEGGDTVYVDTGTYEEETPVSFGIKDSGTTNAPLRVVGNTNDPLHASVLKQKFRTAGGYGLVVADAQSIRLEALCVSNAWTGGYAADCSDIEIADCQFGYAATNAFFAGAGADVTLRRCLVQQSLYNGVASLTGGTVRVYNSVVRDNRSGGVYQSGGNVDVQNSVLLASGQGRYVYRGNAAARFSTDYNDVVVDSGAYVADGFGSGAASRFLIDWQTASGGANDMHSFGFDPQFADVAADDFHPLSQYGRYNPETKKFVKDKATSKLIDMGNPSFAYASESTPNGGRINVGVYGNTAQASRSPTNGTLTALTMSDGGTVRGEAKLYWAYNGFAGNERVNIRFSDDGGKTWKYTIATNIYLNQDGQSWMTTNFPSTSMGSWKIELASNTNIYSRTETLFAIKNDPANYYVNDAMTNGDVYCSAAGKASNDGLSPKTPMLSLEALLGRYKVEPGDTVYVDTGTYPQSTTLTIAISIPGATNNLVIQGSTNEAAGGSLFTNSAATAVMELSGSQQIELRDIRLAGSDTGLLLTESSSNRFFHVVSTGAKYNSFLLEQASDQNEFVQCAALNAFRTGFCMVPPRNERIPVATNRWIGGVMSSAFPAEDGTPVSTGKLVNAASGRLYVSNSVFAANQPTFDVYDVGNGVLAGDYNFYSLPHGESRLSRVNMGNPYGVSETSFADLASWQRHSGCDAHSLAGDPQFADLEGGNLHPKSQGGRYDPATDRWVTDEDTSPLIDAADPKYPFAAEPVPNGGCADMGFWGNNPLGSRTPTNRATYVLKALNDGGVASNKVRLSWIPRGVATNAAQRVRVMVSTNSGETFTMVGNNVPSAGGVYEWDSSSWASCPTMRWQVQCQTNVSWSQASDTDFTLRNGPISYYVNDSDRAGDVYCTAAGAPDNPGTDPARPLDSLQAVLDRYDLEPGDTVYMDAGTYETAASVAWGYVDGGTDANPVVLRGSTNAAAPTVWSGGGLQMSNVRGVKICGVEFRNQTRATHAVDIRSSTAVDCEDIDVRGAKGYGFVVETSEDIRLARFSAMNAATNGVAAGAVKGLHLESGVLVSNTVALLVRSGTLQGVFRGYTNSYVTMTNCALDAVGYRMPAIELRGTLISDYNNFDVKNGGVVAISYLGNFLKEYNSVGDWSAESGLDVHSLSHDPLFADAKAGDFRLKSTAEGDSETSPLVDAGNPMSAYASEPSPNGGRINIGRYGNTGRAARTPSAAMLTLVSYHDGGRASGTNAAVAWNFTGGNANERLTISYSADGGATWTVLATNVPASAGSWTWNTELCEQSVQAKLRLQGSSGAVAETADVFSVRNQPYNFYINDNSRSGDVYCTAIGRATNNGLSPASPMLDLNRLLEKYDLEAGDTVFIDTGVYDSGVNPWRITQADSAGIGEDGTVNTPAVVFQGSTNSLLNGTVLNRNGLDTGIQVDYAAGVELRNITVSNTTGRAVSLNNSYGVKLEWMVANQANSGFYLVTGSGLEVRHCVSLNAQNGVTVSARDLSATNTVFPVIENCAFWETSGYAVYLDTMHRATVRNSILSVLPGHYAYGLGFNAELTADYNAVPVGNGVRVYREAQELKVSPVPIVYESLGAWSAASGQDLHSYDGNPKIADTNDLDFHLLSQAGRWNAATRKWVKDAETSPLVDAGNPDTDFASEPAPNGGRANIGLYGGTTEASKTPTNSVVRLLTLNRGGVASGLVSLNWLVTGAATGSVFDVEFSRDGGATWQNVAKGLPATLNGLKWNSVAVAATPMGRWRLTDAATGGVWATSEEPFVLHNGGISYYVNDSYTEGDVYCTAPGSSSNTGLSPASPKRWVGEILDSYNLEPGDEVYVDTGDYLQGGEIAWGDLDSGRISYAAGDRVSLKGSTNEFAGGTRFILETDSQRGFAFDGAYGVNLEHLTILGGAAGVGLEYSYFIDGKWLRIQNASNAVSANMSSNITLDHSVLQGNWAGLSVSGKDTGDILVDHSVLWSNRYGVYVNMGSVAVSNSVVNAAHPGAFAYYIHADQAPFRLTGDYNGLYVGTSGRVAGYQTGAYASSRTSVYATVSAWGSFSGNDIHSLPNDPRVADPAVGDFHLKSQGGRLSRKEDGSREWVFDAESSTLLDAGNPADASWTEEPDPNGRRLNIGLYGGTAEASRSVEAGTVTLLSLNDGGTTSGETELSWTVGGAATNYSLCLDYSPDNGNSWTNIVCGIPATEGRYLWDSTPYGRSALGRWRAYCVENTAIEAVSLSTFVLRNGGSIYYYVNNALETNDVYCTAAGDDANDGLTPETPKASIQAILDVYELAPEDVVLVDAGTYSLTSPTVIDQTDSGWLDEGGRPCYVTIQGSTDPAAPTVVMTPSRSFDCVFSLSYAEYIRLKDMTIRNAATGVAFDHAVGCRLENIVSRDNNNSGVDVGVYCENIVLRNSILWNNLSRTSGVAVAVGQADVHLDGCVLWGSPTSIEFGEGTATLSNSVAYASGSSGRALLFSAAASPEAFSGDYNCYYVANSALIAENRLMTGGADYYNNLPGWRGVSGGDRHSMLVDADPGFVDAVKGNFHLVSRTGYYPDWQPDADLTNSVLLDAGCPTSGWENEPEPNGGVVNIGAYGNTSQASMSETGKWVRAVSYNEGGTMSSDVLLYWNYGGMEPGTLVQLDYSTDYEETWTTIVSGIPVGQREYEWDVSQLPLCLALKWRIQVQDEREVQDTTDNYSMVKTHTYDYYINDASTEGDVYCKAAGMSWYDGATGTNAASPLDSLNDLLALYPVGAGDRIFIDTGTYELTDAIRFTDQQMGAQGMPLEITGSTNWASGGTLFKGNEGKNDGLQLVNIRYVDVSNLRFTEMRNGLALQYADGIALNGIESFGNRTNGISAVSCGAVSIANSLMARNGTYGYNSEGQMGSNTVHNATFWGNGKGAWRATQGILQLDNSILVQTNRAPACIMEGSAGMSGDYNLFGIAEGGLVATNAYLKAVYANLSQWTDGTNNVHSWVGDPLFADAENGDFHLKSRVGRWKDGGWVTDTDTSWAVDAGEPTEEVGAEPVPNGGRINLGRYGGTEMASKADASTPEVYPLTFRDGGVAPYGQLLVWLYRGLAATNMVEIQYAPDGVTWQTVDRVRITASPYEWRSTDAPSPEALWRVVLVGNTNVTGATEETFIFRPTPLVYYVNDDSLTGDVYTTAVGNPTNGGYRPGSPLDSVKAVFDRYSLAGGDKILVDTGIYETKEAMTFTAVHSGEAADHVRIVGSTNQAAGGSLLVAAADMDEPAFVFFGTSCIDLADLSFSGFTNAVSFNLNASYCVLSNLDVVASWGPGISFEQARHIDLARVLVREGTTNGISLSSAQFITFDGCVVWSNAASALLLGSSSSVTLTNSVLSAFGLGNYCIEASTNVAYNADYNNLYVSDNAEIAVVNGMQYARLPQWVAAFKQDVHSLSTDPLFADPGNGDFHLRSRAGRWNTATGKWVKDPAVAGLPDYSPMIDMGSTNSPWADEPAPNGERRNIGLYGGTWQASKSNTNAWFLAVTAMSGGLASGTFNLVWGWGGAMDPNADAMLWYSYDDGGSNWVFIANTKAGAGQFYWESTKTQAGTFRWPTSPAARWKIHLTGDTNIWDLTDMRFGLRNSPFTYYLNDLSLEGDIYTTGIGNDDNLGCYPAAPRLTLQSLLENEDFEPTDRILVDTGVYSLSDTNHPIVWEAADSGEAGSPVVLMGSTNGTAFVASNRFAAGYIFSSDASWLDISDIAMLGGEVVFNGSGLVVSNLAVSNGTLAIQSEESAFRDVDIYRGSATVAGKDNAVSGLEARWGTLVMTGTNVTVANSLVYVTNASATGIVVRASGAVVSNSTVVATRGTAVANNSSAGTLWLGHNILVAGTTAGSGSAIEWNNGGLVSDWNDLVAGPNAWIGSRHGKWERLAYWQAASGQDAHSVSFEPGFQNETQGDFHLNSKTGRWKDGEWKIDGEHSAVIDLGNPSLGSGNELMPNGYRRNLGAYGGTPQASKSLTNRWVTALTANDGGVLKGSNVVLRWAAGGISGNETATIAYSADGGTTWSDIATGVSLSTTPSGGEWTWNSSALPNAFNALWRITVEGTGESDVSDTPFSLRNKTQAFYVNDASTDGDIYCSAAGSDANDGLTKAKPKATLQAILDQYDLEGGDTVYVDTGAYTESVRVIWSRSGEDGKPVTIVGNTNLLDGTMFNGPATTNLVFDVKASDFELWHLGVSGTGRGVVLETNVNVVLGGMLFKNDTNGVVALATTNLVLINSAFWNTAVGADVSWARDTTFENLTFALPTGAALKLADLEGANVIQNNIFAPASGAAAYTIGTGTSILQNASMDYNLYDFGAAGSSTADSWFYKGAPADLRHWQLAMENDWRSAITNADLYQLTATKFDAHPKSTVGRFLATAAGGSWKKDSVTSWAVDHGNPYESVGAEPKVNGGRRNIGTYGGTVQASKSATNMWDRYDLRTLDDTPQTLRSADPDWPLVWSAELLGTNRNENIIVWFTSTGEDPKGWIELTRCDAFSEYYLWNLADEKFLTGSGQWLITDTASNILAISSANLTITRDPLGISRAPYDANGLMRFEWKGGLGGQHYWILYSDDFGKSWCMWPARYNGPAKIHRSNFTLSEGEATSTFEDRTSYEHRTRWYTITTNDPTSMMTNGVYVP